jgi:hypothetical protein
MTINLATYPAEISGSVVGSDYTVKRFKNTGYYGIVTDNQVSFSLLDEGYVPKGVTSWGTVLIEEADR